MKLMVLFGLVLIMKMVSCSNYNKPPIINWLLGSHSRNKRQNEEGWVWQDDYNNDVFKPGRFAQTNNNDNRKDDEDTFVFDAADDSDEHFHTPYYLNPHYHIPEFTTVAVPGMGTTRTPCEDTCLLTPQYNPVCGTDNVSYFSKERLLCAQRCGKNVRMRRLGICSRRDMVV